MPIFSHIAQRQNKMSRLKNKMLQKNEKAKKIVNHVKILLVKYEELSKRMPARR